MKRTVLLALALGVALPVSAQAQDAQDDHHHQHDDRSNGGDRHDHGRGDRGAQPNGRGAPQADTHDRAPGPAPQASGNYVRQPGGPDDRGDARGGRPDWHGAPGGGYDGNRGAPGGGWDRGRTPPQGNWDRGHGAPQGSWDRDHGGAPGNWDRDHRPPAPGYGRPPYGSRDWRAGAPGGWNRDWRQDQRFDWQRYRAYNRDRFRAPRYFAPRGYDYGYRRWYPGIRIAPFFYAQQYWIADPFEYHLPPPPPGCAWVRYYNDVALVDLGDGDVIDVIPDFFF